MAPSKILKEIITRNGKVVAVFLMISLQISKKTKKRILQDYSLKKSSSTIYTLKYTRYIEFSILIDKIFQLNDGFLVCLLHW